MSDGGGVRNPPGLAEDAMDDDVPADGADGPDDDTDSDTDTDTDTDDDPERGANPESNEAAAG